MPAAREQKIQTNSNGRRYVKLGDLVREETVRNEIKRQANIEDSRVRTRSDVRPDSRPSRE